MYDETLKKIADRMGAKLVKYETTVYSVIKDHVKAINVL